MASLVDIGDHETRVAILQGWLNDLNDEIRSRKKEGKQTGRAQAVVVDAQLQLDLQKADVELQLSILAETAALARRFPTLDARLNPAAVRILQPPPPAVAMAKVAPTVPPPGSVKSAVVPVPGRNILPFRPVPVHLDQDGVHPTNSSAGSGVTGCRGLIGLKKQVLTATPVGSQPPSSECACCQEKQAHGDLAHCACGHQYCGACLRQLFETTLTDETLFPPRCCHQEIPTEGPKGVVVQLLLGPALLGRFRDKKMEIDKPNQMYCYQPHCLKCIPPKSIQNNVGTCIYCRSQTCTICKGSSHKGTDCPQEEGTKQLLVLAKAKGWKQCPSCHRVVELNRGCNHMSQFALFLSFPLPCLSIYLCTYQIDSTAY